MATLIGIAFKTEKDGAMISAAQAEVTQAKGVEEDIYGRPGNRQVTLLSSQQWQQACEELDKHLSWLTRRANLLIDGLSFSQQDLGKRLAIGELVLEITGETDPCNKMDLAYPGLEKALQSDWRGGVTCRVIQGAHIQLNNSVSLTY
ncbi:MOSC domain-containing protein [Shewanella schlegeliana]|uniref:MOSC domain-containing protein n=1 Tax=Shewanella schlegeliana TaxID=190308 RepID=A0ABS1T446_9GAMM|nr:MOSC domain-containing protein [Shewanella schlegeliana]MBL4915340.1 MOSC domain-containing protein [Shewanella schlegeliana]MCL1111496.1 MOSC domain-containing protein [Shewanella schlegeliana]GIU35022.1 molybdenum cofactor biosynthesis protein [Shewanella schlegeliana]